MLTRVGIPVSTTFLVLSAFASTVILEKVLLKSIVGYAIAASAAYAVWFVVSKYINEKDDEITDPKNRPSGEIHSGLPQAFFGLRG